MRAGQSKVGDRAAGGRATHTHSLTRARSDFGPFWIIFEANKTCEIDVVSLNPVTLRVATKPSMTHNHNSLSLSLSIQNRSVLIAISVYRF